MVPARPAIFPACVVWISVWSLVASNASGSAEQGVDHCADGPVGQSRGAKAQTDKPICVRGAAVEAVHGPPRHIDSARARRFLGQVGHVGGVDYAPAARWMARSKHQGSTRVSLVCVVRPWVHSGFRTNTFESAQGGATCAVTIPNAPPSDAADHDAARVVAAHPEQGWSLLCTGVVLFDDTGELLPDGQALAPHRPAALIAA